MGVSRERRRPWSGWAGFMVEWGAEGSFWSRAMMVLLVPQVHLQKEVGAGRVIVRSETRLGLGDHGEGPGEYSLAAKNNEGSEKTNRAQT